MRRLPVNYSERATFTSGKSRTFLSHEEDREYNAENRGFEGDHCASRNVKGPRRGEKNVEDVVERKGRC